MANISELGNLEATEPIDLPQYKAVTESQPMPRKGVYTVRAPNTFQFGATKSTPPSLSAQVDPTIVGPTNEGYTLRFTKVSAKSWPDPTTHQPVSQLGRYLKAAGLNESIGSSAQEKADAVERTAGAVYKTLVDWRAYCKGCGFQVEGEEKFPTNGNGAPSPWVECPNCFEVDAAGDIVKDKNDQPVHLKVRGNAYVSRFLSNG